MEDIDFIFDSVRVTDKRSVGVYGVLDGHGGKECGNYPIIIFTIILHLSSLFTSHFFIVYSFIYPFIF